MTRLATHSLIAISALTAATSTSAEIQVGLQAGANFASMHPVPGEPGSSFSARTLGATGGLLDVRLDDRLSLRLEPMLLLKGTRFRVEPDSFLFPEGLSGSFRLSYLELPMLLRLSVGGDKLQPYLIAGPTVGYLLGARARAQAGTESIETDAKDAFKKIDLGLSVGGGLRLPVGRASVFLEGRYALGLWNVEDDTYDSKLKTRGFQVGSGVTFLSFGGLADERPPPPQGGPATFRNVMESGSVSGWVTVRQQHGAPSRATAPKATDRVALLAAVRAVRLRISSSVARSTEGCFWGLS